MFKKILIAEDMDFINSGIKSELSKLDIEQLENVFYCDEALLKLKRAQLDHVPFDLLISDLSFEADHQEQKIASGFDLIKNVRQEFPELKIIVFSVEDKAFKIQSLFNEYHISAYVWKSREGLKELKKAIQDVYNGSNKYISRQLSSAITDNNAIEISDYDLFLINGLSKGYYQDQISKQLEERHMSPSSVSAIEKRLKILKEYFNANNPTHLVSIAKDLGLV